VTNLDPPPLDYQSPRPGFNKRHFWAGLAISLLVCAVCFILLFVTGAYYFENDTGKPRHWAWLSLLASAATLGGMTWVAVRMQRRRAGRGLLLGVLLGLGLSALPLGLCFYGVGASAFGG